MTIFSIEREMDWKTTFLVFSLISTAIFAEKARYDFYRVYEIKIENKNHLKLMTEISAYPDGVIYFSIFFKHYENPGEKH